MRSSASTSFAVGAAFALTGCGSGGGAVQDLLCGDGLDKSKMTLGAGQLLRGYSDEELGKQLNTLLGKVGVSSSMLEISGVSSASDGTGTGEEFRFLTMEGSLASATGFLVDALTNGLSLDLQERGIHSALAGTPGYTFLQPGFQVSATAHVPNPLLQRISELADMRRMTLASVPDSQTQWAYQQNDYAKAWQHLVENTKVQSLNRKIRVAVIDTGVNSSHEALRDVVNAGLGKSFVEGEDTPEDQNGHGTHCAGIIAGRSGKMAGVAAPLAEKGKLEIIPIKVLGKSGSGGNDSVQKGILYAIEQKVDVISMSLGGGRDYSSINDAEKSNGKLVDKVIQKAIDAGIIVVVAAGNESCQLGGECQSTLFGFVPKTLNEYIVHPCSYDGTICVGATDPDETLAEYSNYWSGKTSSKYRTKADVNAPGTAIFSTWIGGKDAYNTISGTSMATPYVAGLAALLKANKPDIRQAEAMALLNKSQVYPTDIKTKSDTGRVDLAALARTVDTDILGQTSSTVPAPSGNGRKANPPPGSDQGGQPLNLWSFLCHK